MPRPPAPTTDREIIARYPPEHPRALAEEDGLEAVERLRSAIEGYAIAAIRTCREGSNDGLGSELDSGRLLDRWGYPPETIRGADGASPNPQ